MIYVVHEGRMFGIATDKHAAETLAKAQDAVVSALAVPSFTPVGYTAICEFLDDTRTVEGWLDFFSGIQQKKPSALVCLSGAVYGKVTAKDMAEREINLLKVRITELQRWI